MLDGTLHEEHLRCTPFSVKAIAAELSAAVGGGGLPLTRICKARRILLLLNFPHATVHKSLVIV